MVFRWKKHYESDLMFILSGALLNEPEQKKAIRRIAFFCFILLYQRS